MSKFRDSYLFKTGRTSHQRSENRSKVSRVRAFQNGKLRRCQSKTKVLPDAFTCGVWIRILQMWDGVAKTDSL